MKETLKPGLEHELRFVVPPSKTVPRSIRVARLPVDAAGVRDRLPRRLPQWACLLAVKPHLDWPAEQTVGTHVDVSHSRDAAGTRRHRAREARRRRRTQVLRFEVDADDGDGPDRARHARARRHCPARGVRREGRGEGDEGGGIARGPGRQSDDSTSTQRPRDARHASMNAIVCALPRSSGSGSAAPVRPASAARAPAPPRRRCSRTPRAGPPGGQAARARGRRSPAAGSRRRDRAAPRSASRSPGTRPAVRHQSSMPVRRRRAAGRRSRPAAAWIARWACPHRPEARRRTVSITSRPARPASTSAHTDASRGGRRRTTRSAERGSRSRSSRARARCGGSSTHASRLSRAVLEARREPALHVPTCT